MCLTILVLVLVTLNVNKKYFSYKSMTISENFQFRLVTIIEVCTLRVCL